MIEAPERLIRTLHLVPKPVEHPRPISTYYYAHERDPIDQWARIGRAGSLRGAVRAATVKLFDGEIRRADIYGPDGVRMGHIARQGRKILIVLTCLVLPT